VPALRRQLKASLQVNQRLPHRHVRFGIQNPVPPLQNQVGSSELSKNYFLPALHQQPQKQNQICALRIVAAMAIATATGVVIATKEISVLSHLIVLRKQLVQPKLQQIAHLVQKVEIATGVNDNLLKRR
jgi:hypothetical protein